MYLIEAATGTLRVHERILIRNTSLPPKAQYSDKTFEIVLPADAELEGASATRPGGMATNTRLVPLAQKGHYTLNIPIQPNKGEKETMFEVQYHLAYNGSYTFSPRPQMPADNLVIYAAKGIDFKPSQGSSFDLCRGPPGPDLRRKKHSSRPGDLIHRLRRRPDARRNPGRRHGPASSWATRPETMPAGRAEASAPPSTPRSAYEI